MLMDFFPDNALRVYDLLVIVINANIQLLNNLCEALIPSLINVEKCEGRNMKKYPSFQFSLN